MIDETQDIPETTVDEVRRCCDRNGSVLLVIHDSNQKLERKNVEVPARFTRVLFNKVLRKHSQIGELSSRFYFNRGSLPQIVGPSGLPVAELRVDTGKIFP